MRQGSTVGQAWAECESVIRRFEDAWRDDQRPDVGSFARLAGPHAAELLVELVHVDLEFRVRAGDPARVEDYLVRFPDLRPASVAVELIAAEFDLRNRHGQPAAVEEYAARFPEHAGELRARFPAGGTGALAATRVADRPGVPLPALVGVPAIRGYDIEGELGRGGMGVVYKARDRNLRRAVAVKTFATAPRPDACARFAREAEAMARLDHPHIAPVYEVGEWHPPGAAGVPFFVMKLYPGGSLDAAPAGPGTDLDGHAAAVETIARAVHHAHQRGVLHRDLKPSNILLDADGQPHVADFGLAARVDPDGPTLTVGVVGTPSYMAPEQARSPKQVSTAADVYGLGAVLYQRLTGRAPFRADTALATLEMVTATPVERPSAANPCVPRDLDTICLKCLEKDPARRYASAAELADDLGRWRAGLPIAARPVSTWEHAWRRVRRNPLVAAMVLTTLAALVTAVVVLADVNEQIAAKERETKSAYNIMCGQVYKLEADLAEARRKEKEAADALEADRRATAAERVALAGRLLNAGAFAEAAALLDACPERFRGPEWRWLDRLRHSRPARPAAGEE